MEPKSRDRNSGVEKETCARLTEQLKRYNVSALPVESKALSFLLDKVDKKEAFFCRIGDFDELFGLANQHLCLIVKYAILTRQHPFLVADLRKLSFRLADGFRKSPDSLLKLTVKNNLLTAMIHYGESAEARRLAVSIISKVESAVMSDRRVQRRLNWQGYKSGDSALSPLEDSLRSKVMILLSSYLNLVLSASTFKGKAREELSYHITIVKQGYKIASQVLGEEEFKLKFKNVLKSLLGELGEKVAGPEAGQPPNSEFVILSKKKPSLAVSQVDSLRMSSDKYVQAFKASSGSIRAEELLQKHVRKPSGEARITIKSGSVHKRPRSSAASPKSNKKTGQRSGLEDSRVSTPFFEERQDRASSKPGVPGVPTPTIPGTELKAASRKVSFEAFPNRYARNKSDFRFLKKPDDPLSAQKKIAVASEAQPPLERVDLIFGDDLELDEQDSDSDSLKKGSLDLIEEDLQEESLAASFSLLQSHSLLQADGRPSDLTSSNLILQHKLRNRSNLPDPISFSEAIMQLNNKFEAAKEGLSLEISMIQQEHITEGTGSSPVNLPNRQSLNTAKKTSEKQNTFNSRNQQMRLSAAMLSQPKPQEKLNLGATETASYHYLPTDSLDFMKSLEEYKTDHSRQQDSGSFGGIKNTSIDEELNGENKFLRGIIDILMKQNMDLQNKILQVNSTKPKEGSSFGRSTVVSEQSSFTKGKLKGHALQSSKLETDSHTGFPSDKSISKPRKASPRKLTFDSSQPLELKASQSPHRELNRSSKSIHINPSRFTIDNRNRPEPIQAFRIPASSIIEPKAPKSSLLPSVRDAPAISENPPRQVQKTIKKQDSFSDKAIDSTLEKIYSPLRKRRVSSMSFSYEKGSVAGSRKGDTSLMQRKQSKPSSLLLDRIKLRESFKGDSVTVVRTHTIESFNKKVCSSIRASLHPDKKDMLFELNAYIMADEALDSCLDQQQLKIVNSVYREKEFFEMMCSLEQPYVDMSPNFMMVNESIESLLCLLVVRFLDITIDNKAGTLKPFISTHPQVLWKSQVVRLHGNLYIANLVHNSNNRFWLVIKNTINQR